MSRLFPRTAFKPGTDGDSGERGSRRLPCFHEKPKNLDQPQCIKDVTAKGKLKSRLAFLSHTFLHATMMDLRRHPFADARVEMRYSLVLCPSGCCKDMFLRRRKCHCRCHDSLGNNAIWTSGSRHRMSRVESRSNNRWGYCGDGVWRRGIGERRNPVSRNAKNRGDWLGVAR